MASLALRRIVTDLVDVKDDPIEGVAFHFDESDIYNIYAGIVGPWDTPYRGGFFVFRFQFSPRYPSEPPKVFFVSPNERIRFHPNFYEGSQGRVCLSIINTWHGNQWSAVMNLRSLVLSIQSLFTENPLQNEPGLEEEPVDSIRNTSYNNIVRYATLRWAVADVFRQPRFSEFKEFFSAYIQKHRKEYERLLHTISAESKQQMVYLRSVFNAKVVADFKQVCADWNQSVIPFLEPT